MKMTPEDCLHYVRAADEIGRLRLEHHHDGEEIYRLRAELSEWVRGRVNSSVELACIRNENAALMASIKAILNRDYPSPRDHRPGKCAHGVYYYDTCENCIDEFLLAALNKTGGDVTR